MVLLIENQQTETRTHLSHVNIRTVIRCHRNWFYIGQAIADNAGIIIKGP